MELEAIPGVGEKTAAALQELDDPHAALQAEDVATVATADGISTGRAANIVRNAIKKRHGEEGDFLKTHRAKEIYEQLLEMLTNRAVTNYAEQRMKTLYPSTAKSRVDEVRGLVDEALSRTPSDAITSALEDVEPLEQPQQVRVRERCLATTEAETYRTAQQAIPELPVEVIDNTRELAELARGYSTVVALDETFAGVDVEGDVRVDPDALETPAKTVPERTLAFFANNKQQIQAATAVHQEADIDPPCDVEKLESTLNQIDETGTPIGDEEFDRLDAAVNDIDAAVSTAASVANDNLQSSIRERDVTVEGSDLLSLVEQGAGVDSILTRELSEEYADAIEQARNHLIDALQLEGHEAEQAKRVFPERPTFPVEYNEEAVERLRETLKTARNQRSERLKREIAEELSEFEPAAEELVQTALDLDVELAIAQFAADFDCVTPEFIWEQERRQFEIQDGKNPLLNEDWNEIEPVDYSVEGVVLLSGVNSGGKTSTLDLVSAIVILAQMGLPVPANSVRLTPFEALYYHAKTQGTLDAGAFESTVREFAELATGDKGALVLVDELESITEPGASAKIIAGILETLSESDTTAVFVSHLAKEIQEAAKVKLPVDGIEARGLENGELIVDRSPKKDHLARSTPELIVEKLAEEHETGFYQSLLEKF